MSKLDKWHKETAQRYRDNAKPGDWVEDFDHENGLYENTCFHCHEKFIGHKRRVCCCECAQAAGGEQ